MLILKINSDIVKDRLLYFHLQFRIIITTFLKKKFKKKNS